MNELIVVLQGVSTLTLIKIAFDLGKSLQRMDSRLDEHERRLTRLEDRID